MCKRCKPMHRFWSSRFLTEKIVVRQHFRSLVGPHGQTKTLQTLPRCYLRTATLLRGKSAQGRAEVLVRIYLIEVVQMLVFEIPVDQNQHLHDFCCLFVFVSCCLVEKIGQSILLSLFQLQSLTQTPLCPDRPTPSGKSALKRWLSGCLRDTSGALKPQVR